jgi:hypothetical protein
MTGFRRGVARYRRAAGALAAVAALLLVAGGWAEPAGAAVTTFTMAPAAGPPGTVVHVRGHGCTPGLLGSQGTNFVTVSATTLDVVFRAPVAADGMWSGSFTVPVSGAGVLGSSAPVDAVCVSTGVASLTTLYTPKSFTVTVASPPPTTGPGAPPTTGEPPGGTVVIPGDTTTVVRAPPDDAGDGGGTNVQDAALRHVNQQAAAPRDGKSRRTEAATLRPVGIDARSATSTGGAGLGWLGWTLLLVLLLAALGASAFVWHARRSPDAGDGGVA